MGKYTFDEKEWQKITKALQKKQSDGIPLIDKLMKSGSCPFCGTEIDKDGSKPFVVDQETLTFKTLCCGVTGGACNFVMLTKKYTIEKAIKFLKEFIRG